MHTMAMAVLGGMMAVGAIGDVALPVVDPAITVSGLELEGVIEGENIRFALSLQAASARPGTVLTLVSGDVAYLDGTWPEPAELVRQGHGFALQLPKWRKPQPIRFAFASRPVRDGDWRRTRFVLPLTTTRKLTLICDRPDLDVQFPGALNVVREPMADGRVRVTANLGLTDAFVVAWKPQLRQVVAELVAACEARTLATAMVGALRVDTLLSYQVIQGQLDELRIDIGQAHVTRVEGADIGEWHLLEGDTPCLVVRLNRHKEGNYALRVESEAVLPAFPCTFPLPLPAPRGVIRASGTVVIGSDSAIKLGIDKSAGLVQVDSASLADPGDTRPLPARGLYAFQYASTPPQVVLKAEDIQTVFSADSRLVLLLAEQELTAEIDVELDVRDAPMRDLRVQLIADPAWTVTSVTGAQVAETDVDTRDETGVRVIAIPFKQAVLGAVLVRLRLARALPGDATAFDVPALDVAQAESQRGTVVLAAERGVQLQATAARGLREVFTGSIPMRVEGAQLAYRYKAPGWHLAVGVERTRPAIHTEIFHLTSLGEGVLYASAAITYHIGGAPVQAFSIRAPGGINRIEFTGADIDGWSQTNDLYTVRLRNRVADDYTLLVSYERPYAYVAADLLVGSVETVGTDSEVGFIVVASALNLKVEDLPPRSEAVIPITRDELPAVYAAAIANPILRAYRYARAPHVASIRVMPYAGAGALNQVVEYGRLETLLSPEGEAVTTARYYLKNRGEQHLRLRLPPGALLWSIRATGADGVGVDVPSQASDAGLLIPVRRPPDPNTPLELAVTYAQSLGRLGYWRSGVRGLKLAAPELPDTHTTFLQWTLRTPKGMTVAGISGPFTAASPLPHPLRVMAQVGSGLWAAVLDGPGGRTLRGAWRPVMGGAPEQSFSLTPSLRSDHGAALGVRVVPAWVGRTGSARVLTIALVVAGAAAGFRRFRFSRTGMACCGTLGLLGIAHTSVGQATLGALLAASAVGAPAWLVVRAARTLPARLMLRLGRAGSNSNHPDDDLPFEPIPEGPDARAGGARLALVMLLAGSAALAVGAPATNGTVEASAVVVDSIVLAIRGAGMALEQESSAEVTATFAFRLNPRDTLLVAPLEAVITTYTLGSHDLHLNAAAGGYAISADRGGLYKVELNYRVPVVVQDARCSITLPLPANLRNRVVLTVPMTGLDVDVPDAVWLQVAETNAATRAEVVMRTAAQLTLAWQPRVRRVATEHAVVYSEVNTLALLRPGLVELVSHINYTIPQGELREARVRMPEGISVTAVHGVALANWSYDAATRVVLAVLAKPVSGEWALTLTGQAVHDGLPYRCQIAVPEVLDAVRQHGTVAVGGPATVQVRVLEAVGALGMNVEDFADPMAAVSDTPAGDHALQTLRRAYRYLDPAAVALAVETDGVAADIQVVETASVSLADERIVCSARLALTVSKAGVFVATLDVPADYDVETLTGPDVSHWDDAPATNAVDGHKRVRVYFRREIMAGTTLDVVMARAERGLDAHVRVPEIGLLEARRHTGVVTISGERGVRLAVVDSQGVDARAASGAEATATGLLVFEILRPGWVINLKADVMQPVIKPEVLHHVELNEGMLHGRAIVRYRIENAGTKRLLIQAPQPGVSLTVTGREIARVCEIDPATGTWEVDLHNKVQDTYRLVVTYQMPYDVAAHTVHLRPIVCRETEVQRGYLVVSCDGRMRVEPAAGDPENLKPEDPRAIPVEFGAGDLSGAIRCYRLLRPDATLGLALVRHDKAGVLTATIEQVRLESVVSAGNAMLTCATVQLRVGDKRSLAVTLPGTHDTWWAASVNGKAANVAREGAQYLIPLDEGAQGGMAAVEFVYAGRAPGGLWRQRYVMPKFALPVQNVTWLLRLPSGRHYGVTGGSMAPMPTMANQECGYDLNTYLGGVAAAGARALERARAVMDSGESLAQAGRQGQARRAFAEAMVYSESEANLNEDARIQLRNLEQQQWTLALVNRRAAVRLSRNIVEGGSVAAPAVDQNGDFAPEMANQVSQCLSRGDKEGLAQVAARMIEQQASATGGSSGIHVAIPAQGSLLQFRRDVQVDPSGDLDIRISAWPAAVNRGLIWVPVLALVAGLFLRLAPNHRLPCA